MLAALYDEYGQGYFRKTEILEIDSENLLKAHETFIIYQKRKIILNDSFNDDIWVLSNQKKTVHMNFEISEEKKQKPQGQWLECSTECYRNCIKAYCVFSLGNLGLESLCDICNVLKKLPKYTQEEILSINKHIHHIIGLLKILPGSCAERDYLIEELEEKYLRRNLMRRKSNQRYLADFKSYLRFEEILNDFWRYASKKEKIFYFPIYLWWKLTSILPLRPTELLLTPHNCLDTDGNGNNVLTVRRTKLKGGSEKITYRIEGDYEYKKYIITPELADEIRVYLKAIENKHHSEINTLFSLEPHYGYLHMQIQPSYRYYTYNNLYCSLHKFYDEVVRKSELKIKCIKLGDTRHLAMVNLIITGGSPVICMELAGHSNIDISSHYYSNISSLVECVTLERYRRSKSKSAKISGRSKYGNLISEQKHRISDGWCDVMAVKDGDISECLKASDQDGHIGACGCCIHHWPDMQGMRLEFLDAENGKKQVDTDVQFLMKMIQRTRSGIGYTEDIEKALLKLQRSSDHYSKCLWEKYLMGGKHYVKTEKN